VCSSDLKSNGFGHSVDGEKISGSRAAALDRQFQDGQFWYDVNTGQFNYGSIKEEWAEKIIQRINEALEAGVEAAEEAPPAEVESPTAAGTTVRTAAGPGIQNRPVRPNKYGGYCVKCGQYVAPGEGHTYYIDHDDAYEHSGWVVEHSKEGC